MNRLLTRFALLTLLAIVAQPALAQTTIIDDDLNMDTSADYTVVNGGYGAGDGTVEFGYDYSDGALGIPVAPGTSDGSQSGLRVSVNDTFNNGGDEGESYTFFHNTDMSAFTDYTVTVDVWMGVWAPGDTGSTESAQIGVAGDGTTAHSLFETSASFPTRLSGSGHFLAVSGDGADSSDYRHWESGAPVNQFDLDYLSPDMDTNVTGANFVGFFDQIANSSAEVPGSIGNGWATIKVEVSGTESTIKYYVRGATDATTGDPGVAPEFLQVVESDLVHTGGFVNFSLADMYSSVATVPEDQFAIFDNLLVTGTGTPSPDGDFNDDGNWDGVDIDDLVAEVVSVAGGGMPDTAFDLTSDGTVNDADIVAWLDEAGPENGFAGAILRGDANVDGTVDGSDFLAWNGSKFTSGNLWTGGDFNADGVTDGSDFLVWNGNKFQSSDSVASVPEPATGLMLLLASLLMVVRRR